MLVAESSSFPERKKTRILLSKRRGSIFIQTDQPVYKPNEKGNSNNYYKKKAKVEMNSCDKSFILPFVFSEVQDIYPRPHLQTSSGSLPYFCVCK